MLMPNVRHSDPRTSNGTDEDDSMDPRYRGSWMIFSSDEDDEIDGADSDDEMEDAADQAGKSGCHIV
jgi:hypothetical protein